MAGEFEMKLGPGQKKLVLIGSMARKNDAPESDYDFIAVIDKITTDIIEVIDDISGEMLYTYNRA